MKTIEKYKETTLIEFVTKTHIELANSLVLIKETATTSRKTGETTFSVSVLPVCEYTDGDNNGKVVRTMLNTFVAQFKVDNKMQDLYDVVYNDKKRHTTLSFASMLNTSAIYVVDSNGKVETLIVSDVPLSKTALKICDTMNILSASNTEKKKVINAQVALILNQAKYLRNINAIAEGKNVTLVTPENTDTTPATPVTALGILNQVRALAD